MVEQDYVMRMIHQMIECLLKVIFRMNTNTDEEIIQNLRQEEQNRVLRDLADLGKINDAENQLLEELDLDDPDDFLLAVVFYKHLNEKDDDFLEEHDFSRQEVLDGLKAVAERYGYGRVLEPLSATLPLRD